MSKVTSTDKVALHRRTTQTASGYTEKPSWVTWAWLAGLIMVVGGELFAVFDAKSGDTISEATWLLTRNHNLAVRWTSRLVILGLFVWLIPHFWFGMWS